MSLSIFCSVWSLSIIKTTKQENPNPISSCSRATTFLIFDCCQHVLKRPSMFMAQAEARLIWWSCCQIKCLVNHIHESKLRDFMVPKWSKYHLEWGSVSRLTAQQLQKLCFACLVFLLPAFLNLPCSLLYPKVIQVFNLEPLDKLVPLIYSVMGKKKKKIYYSSTVCQKYVLNFNGVDNYFYCMWSFSEVWHFPAALRHSIAGVCLGLLSVHWCASVWYCSSSQRDSICRFNLLETHKGQI